MKHRASLFSQQLDRVAFIAYFLGAIVPLVALTVVVDRFVLPTVGDRLAAIGLMGAVVSIAVLSLASFLTLRRTTRHTLAQIDRDNARLGALLDAASMLSSVHHEGEAAGAAANGALELTGACACLVFGRGEPGAPPHRLGAAGVDAEKLEQELAEPLLKAANLVLSGGRPLTSGREGSCPPLVAAPLPGEAAPTGVIVAIGRPRSDFDTDAVGALSTLGGITAVAMQNANLQDSQRNFFTHVTDMLVAALDSHLGYHHGHGARVARYANLIGRKLELAEHRLERLHFGALLHDIGMLKVERQSQMNRRAAARHTVLGARMLSRIRLWRDLTPIVHHHHEWWDGSGYPDGLSGTAIALEARIISLADAFDTVSSQSSYKQALPFEAAVQEIESCAGTQFDPDVVAAFTALVRDGTLESVDES